jgi:hypothetical protein
MARQDPPSPRALLLIGGIAAAIGLYFMIVGLGLVPSPGKAKAPMWVVFLAGLAFFLGGIAALMPALAGKATGPDGELPPSAPQWLWIGQYLMMVAIFASFAMIGSWVAFGPGTRSFSMSMPFFSTNNAGEWIGRIAFGIGAVITWLCTIAVAISGARKLLRRSKT